MPFRDKEGKETKKQSVRVLPEAGEQAEVHIVLEWNADQRRFEAREVLTDVLFTAPANRAIHQALQRFMSTLNLGVQTIPEVVH